MNQTSQLLSVPYALYAGNSGSKLNLLGQDFITLQDQTLTVNKVDLADDVDGVLSIGNGGTGSSTAPMVGVITAVDSPAARVVLGLGTAATENATAFATAAQGALADTALQASNNLSDITNVVAARTALGIDVSGTDNSTNVSLAGSLDYLTLSGQAITLGQVDYDTDISNKPTLLQLGTTSNTALAGNTTTISSSQSSAITANTAKTTNVSTDLSISGTTGARTIESSDGTDAIIPIATTSVSGLLSPGLFDEIAANTAKETNVSTNLSSTTAAAQITINSSDGNNVVIAEATNSIAGLMSTTHHDKLDSLISGIITMDGVTSVVANVPGITTNSIVTVSFKSGKNGRDIVSVVPNTDTITITLSNTSSSNAKVMYIAIK
jgi:hypothetical protein